MPTPQAGRGSAREQAEVRLRQDLAQVLSGKQSLYFRFGPEGAVMSVKASEMSFAFGLAIDTRWRYMSPEERTKAVLGWIRKAAQYCRNPRVRLTPGRPLPA